MPTLMVSVSGIRGIIGDGLDPITLVRYTAAYAQLAGKGKIVIGRDARISGEMVRSIVVGTLLSMGNNVVDLGICPTPTVLYNVNKLNAAGGIAISASHNPNEWNALKLLNDQGEFLTSEQNKELLSIFEKSDQRYADWQRIGKLTDHSRGILDHLDDVINLKYISKEFIRKKNFRVLLDCINGAGAYVMPGLLTELGCEVIEINCERTGIFPRPPEPIPENLKDTMKAVKENNVDLGIVVDPDVDRLVLITEEGNPFGEEYTIAQAVRFILSKEKGNVAVNLSTTRAIDDIAGEYGCKVYRAPVGEANVVKKMKEVNAVIGGEGSGGVIYPELVYGRDALTGTVLTLQHLAEFDGKISELKKTMPEYFILKRKIDISGNDPDEIISSITKKDAGQKINIEAGLRIDFDDHWIHFRKSNTEPIIRCIGEATTEEKAMKYVTKYFEEIRKLL